MSSLGIFNKETKTYQKVAGTAEAAVLDTAMSDTSENPVQNKVIKKYVDDKQVEVPIAGTGKAGIVKPADGLTVEEDGTLKVKLDGTTLTIDQVNNVIKLADTLKEKINGALPSANVVNNLTTTEAGFALDARQANPNVDGTLAKQLSELNGSLIPNTNALFTVQQSDYFEIQFLSTVKIGNFIIASLTMHILSNMQAWGEYRIATANSESIRAAGIGFAMSQGTGKAYCLTGGRGYDIDIRSDANPPQNDDWLRGLIFFYQS